MTTSMPFISIIVPVYNVESYLCCCIDSVINQRFDSYELLLVDDGSPDGCPEICDEYAANFEQIRVIHKENGGLSDARNAGVIAARGSYVMFIDSDDYIAEGSLEKIAEKLSSAEEIDILFLNAYSLFPDKIIAPYGTLYASALFEGKSRSGILSALSGFPIYPVNAWQKVVRHELILNHCAFFTKGLYCEDLDWSLSLMMHAKSFACCEHMHYYYRQARQGSIMSDKTSKMFIDMLFIIQKWCELASSQNVDHADFIHRMLAVNYHMILLPRYCDLSQAEKSNYAKEVRTLAWLLRHTGNTKARLEGFIVRAFGTNALILSAAVYRRIIKVKQIGYRNEKQTTRR